MNNKELIISGRHFELTEALKNKVHEKCEKLFRHEERIVRVRIELEYDKSHPDENLYLARGIISINGPDLVASDSSNNMYKSIDGVVQKLDRMLRRRARLKKVKRNHPHSIELPATLPKESPA